MFSLSTLIPEREANAQATHSSLAILLAGPHCADCIRCLLYAITHNAIHAFCAHYDRTKRLYPIQALSNTAPSTLVMAFFMV